MASMRDAFAGYKIPKRRKHEVSESEDEYGSDENSNNDQYADPTDFLQQFGGYASDRSDDDQDQDGDYIIHLRMGLSISLRLPP
jgi:hypothetical protein